MAREPVPAGALDSAVRMWAAFTSPDPRTLEPWIEVPWVRRYCEEFPATPNGLTRTERQAMEGAASGLLEKMALFLANNASEEAYFLGDIGFFRILEDLQNCPQPLLDSELRLTPKGEAVLAGEDDRIRGNGIDLWRGGVHLHGDDAQFRWDVASRRFVAG
jgi:hypothetical protein